MIRVIRATRLVLDPEWPTNWGDYWLDASEDPLWFIESPKQNYWYYVCGGGDDSVVAKNKSRQWCVDPEGRDICRLATPDEWPDEVHRRVALQALEDRP